MNGFYFFFQAEDGIRDVAVTGVQTCALPICVVVDDRADAARVADVRVGRVREVDEVRLVELVERVAVDEHRHGLRRLAGREGEGPARGDVVAWRGGRVVDRRVVD